MRVPEPLYAKRYHDESEIRKWAEWTPERKLEAWIHHCYEISNEMFTSDMIVHKKRIMLQAIVHRLLSMNPSGDARADISRMPVDKQRILVNQLLSRLGESSDTAQITFPSEEIPASQGNILHRILTAFTRVRKTTEQGAVRLSKS